MTAHALEARFRRPHRPERETIEQGPLLVSVIVILLCALSFLAVARHPQPVQGYETIFPAGL